MRRVPQAFTLVELLVVIGIIALLVSILLPALSKARQASLRVACASNLQQWGLTLQRYVNEYDGTLPFGWGSTTVVSEQTKRDVTRLFADVDLGGGQWEVRGYLGRREASNGIWWCPAKEIVVSTDHFVRSAVYGSGKWPEITSRPAPYSLSQLVFMFETAVTSAPYLSDSVRKFWWQRLPPVVGPVDSVLNPPTRWLDNSRHGDGANFSFMDGHVEFLVTKPTRQDYWDDGVIYRPTRD